MKTPIAIIIGSLVIAIGTYNGLKQSTIVYKIDDIKEAYVYAVGVGNSNGNSISHATVSFVPGTFDVGNIFNMTTGACENTVATTTKN